MKRAYKTELDPNDRQRGQFARCAGTARYVFNWGLAEWKRQYEAGEKPSADALRKQFNAQKDELCPWIREMPYAVTEAAFRNLGAAFENFFRRVKNGDSKPGYPRFKKRGQRDSFQMRGYKTAPDRIWLGTALGWVRLKERGYLPAGLAYGQNGGAVYVTISRRADRWYASVQVEEPDREPVALNGSLGIDVGVSQLAVCSDGTVFENPRALNKYERKLKRLQRELSRRTKGGANWRKTKARIAGMHRKIADVRTHAQHQVSHYATVEARPGVIVIEDLNVNGMLKNHRLAGAIADAGVSELLRQVSYKAGWQGTQVVKANRWYASSKTCSGCGCIRRDLTLSQRDFECLECGLVIDRDLNAARNLAALEEIEGSNGPGLPGELECSEALP